MSDKHAFSMLQPCANQTDARLHLLLVLCATGQLWQCPRLLTLLSSAPCRACLCSRQPGPGVPRGAALHWGGGGSKSAAAGGGRLHRSGRLCAAAGGLGRGARWAQPHRKLAGSVPPSAKIAAKHTQDTTAEGCSQAHACAALHYQPLQLLAFVRRWRRFNTDLPGLLDEWAASLFRELDYRHEAANGVRFRELYGHMEVGGGEGRGGEGMAAMGWEVRRGGEGMAAWAGWLDDLHAGSVGPFPNPPLPKLNPGLVA